MLKLFPPTDGPALPSFRYVVPANVSRINQAYIASWASKYKAIADRTAKSYNECKSKGTSNDFCELMNPGDSSSDCSLPRPLTTDLNTEAEQGRNPCLEESRSGLQ
jgi:hypothetical protein